MEPHPRGAATTPSEPPGWGAPPGWGVPPDPPRSRGRALVLAFVALVVIVAFVGGMVIDAVGRPAQPGSTSVGRSAGVDLRITGAAPGTWDPALQGDAASAGTLAQVFEGLTAFDAESRVQPALARAWSVQDAGRRIVFMLRPGIMYSDGRPIGAGDVVASWLRLLDPARPSPLSSLLADVRGATEYLRGTGPREAVGLRAEGDTIVVELRRPASYFLSVTASPSLAIVSPEMGDAYRSATLPASFIGSGGYVPVAQTETVITLRANPNYWAGEPRLKTIEVVTDLEGQSATELFSRGDLDHVSLGSSPSSVLDWSWLRFDAKLGPQLRRQETFSVLYNGFDTRKPPFDDARVRRAIAGAVDWDRLVAVGGSDNDAVATSLVPAGIPARGEADYSPAFDPAAARTELAAAGFPGGAGFPEVTLQSDGGFGEAIARELKAELGIAIRVEALESDEYFRRLIEEPPAFWSLVWIADYPAPHDFLGLLLETGSSNNYGGWSNIEFDDALERAAATDDLAEQTRWYDAAQRIVQSEVPVIPVSYTEGWALSRDGLLGAAQSGVGLIRLAGLAWEDQGGQR
ncbi:MAG: peptide ABC transporter substrate-binding protein [Chloroflexi bacterium]|nr:peptide ABC transporter substrate-binding protein [Chloroflexota bacterium]